MSQRPKNGPSILSLVPPSVNPGFTGPLTLNGDGFNVNSQVSVAGTLYPPTTQSEDELVVQRISAVNVSSPVQVLNGGTGSNVLTLVVT